MNTKPTFVLTVDAARARIFKVDGGSAPRTATLTEVQTLVNPEARVPEGQRHTDSNPTGARGPNGGYQTYDDHRGQHAEEERKRFAKSVADAFSALMVTPSNALVCVTHSMYALLNEAISRHCPKVTSNFHALECTLLKPHDLAAMLTDKGLLPKAAAM